MRREAPTSGRRARAKRKTAQARRADKYDLYQRAVQAPESDVKFLRRIYRQTFGRPPRTLREDFCGTAALCCAWVEASPEARAFGVDLDPEPLAWGREHNLGALGPEARRIRLLEDDVRRASHEPVDLTVAFNFSYFLFKTRADLLGYFRKARRTLRRDGMFVLDIFGGWESYRALEETTDHGDFDYRWEQADFDPIHMELTCHIHFDFPDGSGMRRAFSYEWRMWSIPEVRELLAEAGFSRTEVFWEGTDRRTLEGNGVFTRREHAPDDPSFIAYVAAVR